MAVSKTLAGLFWLSAGVVAAAEAQQPDEASLWASYLDAGALPYEARPKLVTQGLFPEFPAGLEIRQAVDTSTFRVCVDGNGKANKVVVETSSGYDELDSRVAEWMLKSSYRPATLHGGAVGVCNYQVQFEWKIP